MRQSFAFSDKPALEVNFCACGGFDVQYSRYSAWLACGGGKLGRFQYVGMQAFACIASGPKTPPDFFGVEFNHEIMNSIYLV
jgi:hypothetical protein